MDQTPIAVVAAVLAGGSLTATGVLQQRAASRRPAEESLRPRLILSLARDRTWLAGIGTGVLAYTFQAVALAFGALSLVQPIFVSELIFAVPLSVRLNRMRMHRRDWLGLLTVAAGLALGIVAADPRRGQPLAGLGSWGLAVGGVVVISAATISIGRSCGRGPARSSLYALAAAVVMALQSALLAATVALFEKGIVDVFTSWEGYALVPATAAGIVLIMSAYQAGPLAASMPVIDACEPSAAIVLGLALFGEHIRLGPLALAGELGGLLLFVVGIVALDTSPLVHALQEQQQRQSEQPVEQRSPACA
jgi:drug/metabolite transporter (DMT)-like permease